MDFYAHQERAQKASRRLLLLFMLAMAAALAAVNGAAMLVWWAFGGGVAYPPYFFLTNSLATLLIVGGGAWVEMHRLSEGGGVLAERLGAQPINEAEPLHRRLRDVAEEAAIGAGVPVPALHVLDDPSINALAAGERPGLAAIMVTRGALEKLDRDELQGVVAHEFAHIVGGDTRLNTRLTGALYGLYSLRLAGSKLMGHGFSEPLPTRLGVLHVLMMVIGAALFAVGSLAVLAAQVLKAGISRQREFFADAMAVQITRDRDGLGRALRRIAGEPARPLASSSYVALVSHFLLVQPGGVGDWFDTHPPLAERVRRLYGRRMPSIGPQRGAAPFGAAVSPDAAAASGAMGMPSAATLPGATIMPNEADSYGPAGASGPAASLGAASLFDAASSQALVSGSRLDGLGSGRLAANDGAGVAPAAGGAAAWHGGARAPLPIETIPFTPADSGVLPPRMRAGSPAPDSGAQGTAPGRPAAAADAQTSVDLPGADPGAPASALITQIRSASLSFDTAGRWLVALVAGVAVDEPDTTLRLALHWLISPAGSSLRVPLLELLLARVRRWSSAHRRELLDHCRRAIESDGKIESAEWVYYTLARHRLLPAAPATARRRRNASKAAHSRALAALFAMAAAIGEASARNTRDALAEAAALLDVPPPAATPDELDTAELANALDTLLSLPPLDKPLLLKVLNGLARTHGDANYEAFLRAVAAAIDCPVPRASLPTPSGAATPNQRREAEPVL
ncbi:MAG: M48 family metalloprotease [Burkholderiales bacterium]|nr:M48 family metalloprotease [Burkholderiales bacterium]